jgi:hypothetical protein
MRSPLTWFRKWLNNALYEEEGWPHDPLNLGVTIALMYLGFPVVGLISLTLLLTGWADKIPVWVSPAVVPYMFVSGWIVLDERRSRQRSEDGKGHGWIWQMVALYGPRRRFNQSVVAFALVAALSSVIFLYLDRLMTSDLQSIEAVDLIEAIVILSVDLWLIVVTISVHRWSRQASFWGTFKIAVVVMVCINGLVSIENGPFPWLVFVLILAAVLAFPGWVLHVIWKSRLSTDEEELEIPQDLPPWW